MHIVGLLRQNTGDVEGDVAVADDGDAFGVQRPGLRDIGMRVVPVDEVSGTVGSGQVDAGQIKCGIDEAPGGEDHRVIAVGELFEVEVDSVLDIGEQADVASVEDLDQGVDDALDPGVVGGDSVADESEGSRQTVEEIDAQIEITFRLRYEIGRVDPSRTGADDGHPEGTSHSHTSLFSPIESIVNVGHPYNDVTKLAPPRPDQRDVSSQYDAVSPAVPPTPPTTRSH